MLLIHLLCRSNHTSQIVGQAALRMLLVSTVTMLLACEPLSKQNTNKQITIAINPWPGYEFFYLAQQLGYFDDIGLHIKLVQAASLSDVQRSYINGRVDGMASTMVEVVQASQLSNYPISIVLVPDYSNGGDVIIGRKDIHTVSDLKGRIIGAEVGSLGLYIVDRALQANSLTLDDISLKNIAQHEGEQLLLKGTIDAFASYASYAINALENESLHTIFDTSQIPYKVVDTIAIRRSILKKDPSVATKIQRAWQLALDYTRDNPQQAYAIMAAREGITPEAFENSLNGLKILDLKENQKLFASPENVQKIALEVCKTLYDANAFTQGCDTLDNVVHHY